MSTPTRDQNKFIVRMPDGLRDRIAGVAKANGRSMNSEIIRTLESAYPHPVSRDDVERALRTVLERLEASPGENLSWNLQILMPELVGTVEAGAVMDSDDVDLISENGTVRRYTDADRAAERFDLDKS